MTLVYSRVFLREAKRMYDADQQVNKRPEFKVSREEHIAEYARGRESCLQRLEDAFLSDTGEHPEEVMLELAKIDALHHFYEFLRFERRDVEYVEPLATSRPVEEQPQTGSRGEDPPF